MPQRMQGPFSMGLSQISPSFYRNSVMVSQHPDTDMPSQGSDFNRMLQQHLSENPSTAFRSTLHNIQEMDQDENAENPTSPEASPFHQSQSHSAGMVGSVTTGASHREGPMNASHDRSLFHSLYGQTGGYEPVSGDLTTADMCLSTLYLHELFHRQNRRRSGSTVRSHASQQQQQQHQWQMPHRDGAQMRSAESRPAAEKTPLLYPKKT